MAITFVAAAQGSDAVVGASCLIPAGTLAGHRLVAVLATNAIAGYSHIPPAGWSPVISSLGVTGGGMQFASVYTKVAVAGEAGDSAVFTVTPTGTKDVLSIATYAGSITTPNVVAQGVDAHEGALTTTVDVPVISVPETPALLVTAVSKKGGTAEVTTTPPAGFTQRSRAFATGGGAIAVAIADAAAGGTGDTAVADWDSSISSDQACAFLLALTEGDAPTPTQPTFHRLTVDGWYPPLT